VASELWLSQGRLVFGQRWGDSTSNPCPFKSGGPPPTRPPPLLARGLRARGDIRVHVVLRLRVAICIVGVWGFIVMGAFERKVRLGTETFRAHILIFVGLRGWRVGGCWGMEAFHHTPRYLPNARV